MSRLDDMHATLQVADELLAEIQGQYEASLEGQKIDSTLPVKIKNLLENLRSPLDYIAREISDAVLGLGSGHRTYFPIGCVNVKAFEKHVQINLPGLDKANPSIYTKLESLQSYNATGCRALGKLSRLVNENKHNQLSPQTRTERRGLRVAFPGGGVIDMGPGSSICGTGMISSGGGTINLTGGVVSGDSPARSGRNIQQTVQVWVSFLFSDTGDGVMELLRECRTDVRRAVDDLRPELWP